MVVHGVGEVGGGHGGGSFTTRPAILAACCLNPGAVEGTSDFQDSSAHGMRFCLLFDGKRVSVTETNILLLTTCMILTMIRISILKTKYI